MRTPLLFMGGVAVIGALSIALGIIGSENGRKSREIDKLRERYERLSNTPKPNNLKRPESNWNSN